VLLEHGCEMGQGLLYGSAALIDELAPAAVDRPSRARTPLDGDHPTAARAATDRQQV
jgi:hypothetical protein